MGLSRVSIEIFYERGSILIKTVFRLLLPSMSSFFITLVHEISHSDKTDTLYICIFCIVALIEIRIELSYKQNIDDK